MKFIWWSDTYTNVYAIEWIILNICYHSRPCTQESILVDLGVVVVWNKIIRLHQILRSSKFWYLEMTAPCDWTHEIIFFETSTITCALVCAGYLVQSLWKWRIVPLSINDSAMAIAAVAARCSFTVFEFYDLYVVSIWFRRCACGASVNRIGNAHYSQLNFISPSILLHGCESEKRPTTFRAFNFAAILRSMQRSVYDFEALRLAVIRKKNHFSRWNYGFHAGRLWRTSINSLTENVKKGQSNLLLS